MDPNETLAQMRAAIETFWATDGSTESADDVAVYAAALDQWLSRGGFLPTAWSR